MSIALQYGLGSSLSAGLLKHLCWLTHELADRKDFSRVGVSPSVTLVALVEPISQLFLLLVADVGLFLGPLVVRTHEKVGQRLPGPSQGRLENLLLKRSKHTALGRYTLSQIHSLDGLFD